MGWNSWDSYGFTIDEEQFRANAEVLASLVQYGWKYAVIDEGWYMANPDGKTLEQKEYLWNDNGLLIPAPSRFPSDASGVGFRPLADWIISRASSSAFTSCAAFPARWLRQIFPSPARTSSPLRCRHHFSLPLGRWQPGHQGQPRRPGLLRLDDAALCKLGVDCPTRVASAPPRTLGAAQTNDCLCEQDFFRYQPFDILEPALFVGIIRCQGPKGCFVLPCGKDAEAVVHKIGFIAVNANPRELDSRLPIAEPKPWISEVRLGCAAPIDRFHWTPPWRGRRSHPR